ncbi:MAG: methylated-DNA--[protein]-cysteine S-methyltransferase [Gemmatimonadales bacterium]|nr:MAG: methylated-DNA--[protein]-cysteine S-methyltransferase [Gemmatimonadales bacterium]
MSTPDLARVVIPESPVGALTLVASDVGLRELRFGAPAGPAPTERSVRPGDHPVLDESLRCLRIRFRGNTESVRELPVDLTHMTEFQVAVLEALRDVRWGTLVTYGDLYRTVGQGSPRSVGQAVGANPVPVVIPCHRVVTGDLRLGGYSGGLERKVALLKMEGVRSEGSRFDSLVRPPEEVDPELPL